MAHPTRLTIIALALALLLAPALAQARAGGGFSMGSRGGQTFSAPRSTPTAPYGAAPLQRSLTQPGATGSTVPGYAGYGRSGFGTGLMGGLLGVGIGSMLFGGHGGYGYGYGGGGMGIFGLLLRLLIVFFIVRFLFRRLTGGTRPGFARPGLGALFARTTGPTPLYGAAYPSPGAAPTTQPPITLQPADYHAFEALLKNIQAAWTASDLNALRTMASPEMVSYFAEQLTDYASRGRRNQVSDVHLQKGDLSQAWQESGRLYATVAMRFSMIDVTYDGAGRVVDGSPNEHVTATEMWTFLRASGGRWMLSAIQQAR